MLPSTRRSFVSSRSLSCKRWLLARLATLWKGNGGSKRRSFRRRTREQATNVSPAENSFLPTSITTLFKVRPWALWMVTAQASLRGSCKREYEPPVEDQVRRSEMMGTLPSVRVGPL